MKDLTYYKEKLEVERDKLAKELDGLGTADPNKPGDWEVKVPDMDVLMADENEVADRAEEQHIDSIVLDELEARYQTVETALGKLEQGTYGVCETCAAPIEEERLEANPSAGTCKAHMNG
jgi:RNA polymerase-binding transcription factor DksA